MEVKDKFEFLSGYMRVLTLLQGFKSQKSFSMSFDKIVLYDFYLKYPETMFGDSERRENYDFEELYSFYHSEPDRNSYHKILRFLISKQLIKRDIIKGAYIYRITDLGSSIIDEIVSPYHDRLLEYSYLIAKSISKLSDVKIKESIQFKSLENIRYSN